MNRYFYGKDEIMKRSVGISYMDRVYMRKQAPDKNRNIIAHLSNGATSTCIWQGLFGIIISTHCPTPT